MDSRLPYARAGYAVTGLDLEPKMLAEAERKAEAQFVFLGEGEIGYVSALGEMADRWPDRVAGHRQDIRV